MLCSSWHSSCPPCDFNHTFDVPSRTPCHNVVRQSLDDNNSGCVSSSILCCEFVIIFTLLQILSLLSLQLYTAGLVFLTQQLAISAILTRHHYLTAVHDISQAWTGNGAAVHALWQQTKIVSSILPILGVVIYLACISTLHIASSTIMQFTAFNSTSTISIQSSITWPNSTVFLNGSPWIAPFQIVPPSSLLASIQTNGLLNNTIYDILGTTDPSFMNATVNATSLQASCGLLSNLTFNSGVWPILNFSFDGLGSGSLEYSNGNSSI